MNLEFFLHMAKHAPIDLLIGMLKENISNYEKDRKNPDNLKMVELTCALIAAKDSLKHSTFDELTAKYNQMQTIKSYVGGKN